MHASAAPKNQTEDPSQLALNRIALNHGREGHSMTTGGPGKKNPAQEEERDDTNASSIGFGRVDKRVLEDSKLQQSILELKPN